VNSLDLCVCEICGMRSAEHAGWFAVVGAGNRLEILPWKDELCSRNDCRYACCGDHLQKLIFSTAARELSKPTHPLATHRGGWNPSSLVPPAEAQPARSNDDAVINVLKEIDSALQAPGEDEEDNPSFDA
jgi:hypothetical protein